MEAAMPAGDDTDFGGGGDEILDAHELGCRGGHLRGKAGSQCGEAAAGCFVGEQPVAEFADGEGADGRKGGGVVGVGDEAGDFVGFVGDDVLFEEVGEREIGEGELGGYALLGGAGGDAGEDVTATGRGGFGQQVAQVGEGVAGGADGVGEGHAMASSA
jgi:hypothetical protein